MTDLDKIELEEITEEISRLNTYMECNRSMSEQDLCLVIMRLNALIDRASHILFGHQFDLSNESDQHYIVAT